jgi:hypothetical protein
MCCSQNLERILKILKTFQRFEFGLFPKNLKLVGTLFPFLQDSLLDYWTVKYRKVSTCTQEDTNRKHEHTDILFSSEIRTQVCRIPYEKIKT